MADAIRTELWLEEFLVGILERAGLEVFVEEIALDEATGDLKVELGGPDSGLTIGRDGQVLEALQHLVASAATHQGVGDQRIQIDIEGYRQRRDQRLLDEAERSAEDVAARGLHIDLPPMPPRERRLVHLAVSRVTGVTTESLGEGEDRFVRILPAGAAK